MAKFETTTPTETDSSVEETAKSPAGLPPWINLGLGGFALLIATGGMLMLIIYSAIQIISPGRFPPMPKENWIGLSIGIGFWLLVGTLIFRRGLKQRQAGIALGAGSAQLFGRIVGWAVGLILAVFIAALFRQCTK